MAITLLAVSITPNPFVGFTGIVAGRMGYPVRLFLAYSAIGKVVHSHHIRVPGTVEPLTAQLSDRHLIMKTRKHG